MHSFFKYTLNWSEKTVCFKFLKVKRTFMLSANTFLSWLQLVGGGLTMIIKTVAP